MARENVRFAVIKTVKKPTTVKFKTKSGETVAFKALKTLKKKNELRYRAGNK
jgi:hypothetical protein